MWTQELHRYGSVENAYMRLQRQFPVKTAERDQDSDDETRRAEEEIRNIDENGNPPTHQRYR